MSSSRRLLLMTCTAAAIATAQRSDAFAVERFAVVVGANLAPVGRAPLRYAHADARAFADVLTSTGGVEPNHLDLLLDPSPRVLLATMDAALKRAAAAGPDGLFVFYYSGHADPDALYPDGSRLSLAEVRLRLADARADLRVGIIDACRGGGWTGSKGLTPTEPFEVDVPDALAAEGLVLISSSSGIESAHESEVLGGSFFTHHWNAALRGAADRDGDGRVTVNEAFAYAREMTVRDTARATDAPQHPSFRMDLHGRDDLVLATSGDGRASLTIQQTRGPLLLLDLRSGLSVLETQAGKRTIRLGLQPGRYLIRRRDNDGVWSTELALDAHAARVLGEANLVRVDDDRLTSKDITTDLDAAVVPDGHWEIQAAAGVRHAPVIDPGLRLVDTGSGATGLFRLTYGIFNRWHVTFPLAFARAGGEPGGLEWIPWFGVPVLGVSKGTIEGTIVTGIAGAGLDVRRTLMAAPLSLNASFSALGSFQWAENALDKCALGDSPCKPVRDTRRGLSTWAMQATLGLSYKMSSTVSINFGAGVTQNVLFDRTIPNGDVFSASQGFLVGFGSIQRRGLRPLPLIRVRVSQTWAVDAHVAVAYVAAERGWEDTYMGGVTAVW